MLFMVVERFRQGAKPVYRRAADQGRLLPAGLEYGQRLDRRFQLMRATVRAGVPARSRTRRTRRAIPLQITGWEPCSQSR